MSRIALFCLLTVSASALAGAGCCASLEAVAGSVQVASGLDTAAGPPVLDGIAPLSGDDLSAVRGGAGSSSQAITDQTIGAVNAGNQISAGPMSNGAVSIDSNAFSGFSGVGNFMMNTGNQNNLESTLSVTIVGTPTGP
jgi:hypothetical protein